ncbi:MAG: UDP-N-acetylmuramoyl-L-alanine--D-glutamate ligase, partial [Rhodospirillaceae bacterium]
PVVATAQKAGRPILGDIELLAEACPAAILIGITGTNGKSTTSALIHHVFRAAGRAVQIGGNFGPPVLGLEPPGPGEAIVLELSSYQLDLTERATFEVAVLLNVTPDHLDRHGDMDGYVAAKKRIFRRRSGSGQIAVVGVDDSHSRALHDELRRDGGWHVVAISAAQELDDGVYVRDGELVDSTDTSDWFIGDIETLRGRHNWQNAAAAWAVARSQGIEPAAIAAALATYPGLPHRLELIAEIDGVRYVNDSKATNGEAAARALSSFDGIYWIAGGVAKEDGLFPADPYLDRVRHVFLIGEAAAAFERHLAGRVPVTRSGDLATAIADARRRADAEGAEAPVVLLSPACASFDQFRNFAARGDRFRSIVETLAKESAA